MPTDQQNLRPRADVNGRGYHQAHYTILGLLVEHGWSVYLDKHEDGGHTQVSGIERGAIDLCMDALAPVFDERDASPEEAWKIMCTAVPRLAVGP